MDEFLKVIYRNYASENGLSDAFLGYFEGLTEKINKTVSADLSNDFLETLVDCAVENNERYFVEGMKLAIDIMEKKYIPRI